MYTQQLNRMGTRLFGYRYLGTFPLDKVPLHFIKDAVLQHFIINTHTSNLPGQHWIAVTVHNNNKAYIFDSFGQPPPRLLVSQLKQRGIAKIYYSKRQIQTVGTTICGQLALKHLLHVDLHCRTRGLSRWRTNLHQGNLPNSAEWSIVRSQIRKDPMLLQASQWQDQWIHLQTSPWYSIQNKTRQATTTNSCQISADYTWAGKGCLATTPLSALYGN